MPPPTISQTDSGDIMIFIGKKLVLCLVIVKMKAKYVLSIQDKVTY